MINYDSKKWWEAISHFKTSYVIRRTVRMVLWMGVFSTAVVVCDQLFQEHYQIKVFTLDTWIFTLLGVMLSLLMVFRLNTAYDRWWEGRKQWGALINHTRGLAVLINGMLPKESHAERRYFAKGISAYVLALSDHLRDNANHKLIEMYSDEHPDSLRRYTHVPNKIVNDLYSRLEKLYKAGVIDGFQLNQLKPETQSFLDIQGACERIKATPIPFAHNFFIKLLVITYCCLVPLVLTSMLSSYSGPILLSMLVSYVLIGIEYISVEIEEPFGLDCNDLPTHNLAVKIEKNVHEILDIELTSVQEEKGQYLVIS
ncbi:MAG: bestrophin family protein [Bacteroidia bacterium]|nr:bestrophin family protein [Bacteroidia bacterium]